MRAPPLADVASFGASLTAVALDPQLWLLLVALAIQLIAYARERLARRPVAREALDLTEDTLEAIGQMIVDQLDPSELPPGGVVLTRPAQARASPPEGRTD